MTTPRRFHPEALEDLVQLENDGETGLLNRLIQEYVRQSEITLKAIATAAAAQQFDEVEKRAHFLKSSSRLLGLEQTGELCSRLEEGARRKNLDPGLAPALIAELGPAVKELLSFLGARAA